MYFNNSEDTDHEQVINPCGLIAWSFFNDSFALKDETGTRVAGADIDKPFKKTTGVAWESDVNMKFKNSKVDSKSKTGDFFENFQYWRNQNCDQYKTEFPDSPNELIMTCRNADAGWCFPGSGAARTFPLAPRSFSSAHACNGMTCVTQRALRAEWNTPTPSPSHHHHRHHYLTRQRDQAPRHPTHPPRFHLPSLDFSTSRRSVARLLCRGPALHCLDAHRWVAHLPQALR